MTTEQPKQESPFNFPTGAPRQLSGRSWTIIGIVFLIFVMFNRILALYTDWRWFQSINLSQIFTTEFSTKIIAFLIAAAVFIILFMINIAVARWQVKRNTIFFSDDSIVAQKMVSIVSWVVAGLLGWLVGSTASGSWLTILEYIKQVPFGISDPFFGLDVSFYIFTLPLMKFAQGWLVIVLFLSLFGAAGIYLLEQRNNLEEGRLVLLPHAQLHLSIIGALIFATFAWGHWLDAFGLLYSDRGVVFGASYTDINVVLPILRVMMGTLKEAWGPVTDLYPTVENKESSPNVVQIVAQNEIVVMVVMEIIIGHSSGMMNICYPVIALEPVLPKLASRDLMLNETSSKKSRNQELQVLLGGAQVQVEADLGEAELTLNEVLELSLGDIVRLKSPANDIVTLNIDGKERFRGEIGLRRFRKSVQITEVIDTEKDAVKRALKDFESKRKEKISSAKEIIEVEEEDFFDEEDEA